MKRAIRFNFPTHDQLQDPLSEASARYRAMARKLLAKRNINPRIVDRLVPRCTDAIEAMTIIAVANNCVVH